MGKMKNWWQMDKTVEEYVKTISNAEFEKLCSFKTYGLTFMQFNKTTPEEKCAIVKKYLGL